MLPEISIIIVNYNGFAYVERCIASVLQCSFQPFDIVVVDNGSTDDSPQKLRATDHPQVRVIFLDKNYGPAKARNEGVKAARGTYLGFLDNDTTVAPDYITEALRVFESDARIGAVQCKLVLMDHPEQIDYVGEYIGTNGFLVQVAPAGTQDVGQFNTPYPILAAKSAGMFIRGAAFDAAGGFDEDYFIYVEETDLCWRIWLGGYTVVFAPTSKVYHKFGTSAVILGKQKNDFNAKFHGAKNYIQTLLKNLSAPYLMRILPLHILLWLGLAWFSLLQGKWQYFLWVHQGIWWNIVYLRHNWSKRRKVQTNRRVADQELFAIVMKKRNFAYYVNKATAKHTVGNAEGFFKSS